MSNTAVSPTVKSSPLNASSTTVASSSPSASASTATLLPQPVWDRTRHFIAGCASGAALVMVGHPFDTLKVRLQTEGSSGRFRGPLHCIMDSIRNEGVLSLYKGVTPPLLGTGVVNALLFGMQGMFTAQVKEWDGVSKSTPATVSQTCRAAMMSGICISFVVTPMEGVKSRLQVQYHAMKSTGAAAVAASSSSAVAAASSSATAAASTAAHPAPLYTGPISCIRYILQHQGPTGLYRGLLPVMFCRISNYAYFGAYEMWKGVYARVLAPKGSGVLQQQGVGQKPTKTAAVFSGGMAGISYWLSCYPVDVIKARMMAIQTPETATMRSTARMIYRRDGLKGFFGGFSPCLARAFPANAAAFLAFEAMMERLPKSL